MSGVSVWSVVLAMSATVWGSVIRADRLRATAESRQHRIASDWSTAVVSGVVAIGVMIALGSRVDGPLPAIVIGVGVGGMISQAMTDLCVHRLPLRVSHLTALAILALGVFDAAMNADAVLADAVIAGVAGVIGGVSMAAVGLFVARLTRGSLGRGDVHFGLPLGALIGWWTSRVTGVGAATGVEGPDAGTVDVGLNVVRNVVTAWGLTAVSAGVVVMALLLARRVDRSSHIPYGPFMVAGTLLALVST